MNKEIEAVLKAIEDEPEISLAIDDKMWRDIQVQALNGNKAFMEQYFSLIARLTKISIRNRAVEEIKKLERSEVKSEVKSEDVMPCPFCGATPDCKTEEIDTFGQIGNSYTVFCGNEDCDAVGPCEKTTAKALKGWNERA